MLVQMARRIIAVMVENRWDGQWLQGLFDEPGRFHMEGQYLPAGDSHILYPVPEGPLSSHRFEAHRIGMENCELLHQLQARDAPRAGRIIESVVQSFDRYTKDVAVYRAARESLLDAVDEYSVE